MCGCADFCYLQHELHTDPVLDQPHDQVCLALEHSVVLPGQRVRVFDGEMQVRSRAVTNKRVWFTYVTCSARSGSVSKSFKIITPQPAGYRQTIVVVCGIIFIWNALYLFICVLDWPGRGSSSTRWALPVFFFSYGERGVQQDASCFQLIFHNPVQFLSGEKATKKPPSAIYLYIYISVYI